MIKGKDQGDVASSEQRRALLFEFKGERTREDGSAEPTPAELFAALSMEEVIAYLRRLQPDVEIVELRILGKVQVLSSSEHLK
jgi:hypothetical protein